MLKGIILPLFVVLLAIPAVASAQTDWEQQVLDQIRLGGEMFSDEGYQQASGATHTASLNTNDSDDFTLALEAGVSSILLGVCDTDCSDIDLMLLDESGAELSSDYEDDDTPILEYTPSYTGRYTVHVYMAKCAEEPCYYGVGLYTASASRTGSASGGKPSSQGNGQSYRGRLESGDEQLDSEEYYDAYDFDGDAGDAVVVDLTSTEFDPYVILLSPSGDDTQNDDYEGSSTRARIEDSLSESGKWRVLVTSYKAYETGSYELTITTSAGHGSSQSGPSSQASAPQPSRSADSRGRVETGSLASGDKELSSGEYYDDYKIRGGAGEYVVIGLQSSEFDPYLILIPPEGEQIENDDHEGDATRSQLALELPEDGQYRVVVTSYKSGETGAYELQIHRPENGAPGSRSERGRLVSGDETLESGEYADAYDLHGRPGQHVRIDASSTDFDTYLILIDPNGEQIENDDAEDQPGHSIIDSDLAEIGTYQVIVTSYQPGETGEYELVMDVGEASSGPSPGRDVVTLELGERTSGRLESGDLQLDSGEYSDLYVFEGEAGQSISVEMSSSEFDTYVQLITPEGEKIDNDDYEGNTAMSRIDLTLRESGRYRIMTTSYRADETGSYELALRPGLVAEVPIIRADASGEGRTFGIFAGISNYGGRMNNLAYTAEDAVRVRDAVASRTGMRDEDAIVLTDEDATVSNVKGAIETLASRMGPNDFFVFFYSGHGDRVPRSGPTPSDPDALDETIELYDAAMTDDEMTELFTSISAGTTLLVLDACFSGGFAKDVISVPGRMGLFSSEEDVTSSVAAKFRAGGYLAAFIADAVGEGLADGDEDGGLSALELSQYLYERYRVDVKSATADFVRTGGPQLGYQHLVVDRGSIGPYQILFNLSDES